MQMAVTAISDMNKRVRGGAAGAKEDWLDTVNKNLEQEQKVRTEAVLELGPGDLWLPPINTVTMHPSPGFRNRCGQRLGLHQYWE